MTLGVQTDSFERITANVACSATAFLVWDTLINFDKEVEYIWQRPNSWVKWTYLFIRHMPYLAQGSIMTLYAQPSLEWNGAQCRAWLIYQAVANETLTVAVEIVLILRIIAMYNRNRLITATVIFLFVAEIATMCAILAVTIPKFEFNPQCIVTAAPLLFSSYWTISLAFESTLFMLTLYKFFSIVIAGQIHRGSIMFMLMKDGTWAYAMIFAIMLLNTLMYKLEKNTLAGICYFWELSVMSFAGSHVLLNLRRLTVHPNYNDSLYSPDSSTQRSCPRPPLSDLRFNCEGNSTLVELTTLPSLMSDDPSTHFG